MILNNEYEVMIASDVSNGRDGIGVEIYFKGKLILEIFRDDTCECIELEVMKNLIKTSIMHICICTFVYMQYKH